MKRMEMYFTVAELIATGGTCTRRNVGAIVVVGDSIRASGVNSPSLPSNGFCFNGGCPRGKLTYAQQPPGTGYAETGCTYVHGEMVALRRFREVERIKEAVGWANGLMVVVSSEPCNDCQDYAKWACANLLWRGM